MLIDYYSRSPCEFYRVRLDFLRTKLDDRFKDEFYLWLGRQLNWQNIQVMNLLTERTKSAGDRILHRLQAMAGKDRPKTVRVCLAQMARELGMSRRQVSKHFNRLVDAGAVQRVKGWDVVVF